MAQENLIYPVGMYYVGSGKASSSVQGEISVKSKCEITENDDQKASGSSEVIDKDEEASAVTEDRSSEDYWEKRKRFTLAFAAGLRKFIQMHPELLRYGPKKNQGGMSATVTSSVATEDGALAEKETTQCGRCVACLKTDDCGKCAFCLDMSKFGGKNELKKLCIRRHCLHAPIKDAPSTGTNSNSHKLNDTPDDSMEEPPIRPIRIKAGVNNDSDFLFPIKEEYLDEDDDEMVQRAPSKRVRNPSPRAKRSRKTTRRSRNDDDVDYKPSQRSRRPKLPENDEASKVVNIKTEIADTPE